MANTKRGAGQGSWTREKGANADYTSLDDYIRTRRYREDELTPEEKKKYGARYAAQTGAERISTEARAVDREVSAERIRKGRGTPAQKYAKGGSVTRGDGVCKKGHTKGRMV